MRGKTDFDKDLDEYLSERSRKQFFFNMVQTFKSKKPEVKLSPDVETYEAANAVKEEKTSKQGFFSRLFSSTESKEFVELPHQDVQPTKDELKFVAQVALNKIKRMPSEELEVFKGSEEFQKFKEVLKRHELIK
ncbi:hypothetical protein HZA97_03560 [Candidatus Woesearchaeota archaeon]|nr:hypothetical protein [Candidatus Woesearchaeota archaeon]